MFDFKFMFRFYPFWNNKALETEVGMTFLDRDFFNVDFDRWINQHGDGLSFEFCFFWTRVSFVIGYF